MMTMLMMKFMVMIKQLCHDDDDDDDDKDDNEISRYMCLTN